MQYKEEENNNDIRTIKKSAYLSLIKITYLDWYWSKVEKIVENLQHRITRAVQLGQYRKVRNLQRLLTKHSLLANLKAVLTVAQKNSGKKMPGINLQLWTITETKYRAARELRKKSTTTFLKQVFIPKSNGN